MRAGLRGSFLYSSAVGEERRRSVICTRVRVSCVFQNNFLPWEARVALVSAIFKTTLLFQNFQTSKQQGRRWYVLAARVVARELMPYAMIRPVSKTALAPLSSNVIPILRALPRICLSLHLFLVFIVGSRVCRESYRRSRTATWAGLWIGKSLGQLSIFLNAC